METVANSILTSSRTKWRITSPPRHGERISPKNLIISPARRTPARRVSPRPTVLRKKSCQAEIERSSPFTSGTRPKLWPPHYAYNLAVSGGAGPKKEAFLNDLCFTLTANSGFVIDAIEAAVLTYSIMGSPVAHAKPLASEMIGVVKFDTLEGAAISFGPTTLSFTAKVQTRQAGENRVRKLPFTLETA